MSMLDELQELFDVAAMTPYDMSSQESKAVCARLTAFCWKFLAPYSDGKPLWYGVTDYSPFFRVADREYAARIYELMWFANLSYIASDNLMLLDEASAQLTAELETGTVPTRSNLILRGCVEYRRKNYRLAKHFISRAHHELIPDSVISPFFAYSRSTCLFEDPYRGGTPSAAASSAEGCCLLVAADAKYIIKYLPNYVDTMLKTGAHETLSLHVRLISTADSTDLMKSAETTLAGAREKLGSNLVISEAQAPNVRDTRSWFAAERFLHARALVETKNRLIITDLDYGLRENPAEFLDWSRKFDVCGLLARDDEFKSFFPWLKMQAGTVVVANSPAGHYFLDSFADYFRTSFVGAGWNWGIDQNALANAYENIEGRAATGNINSVRQPFYIPRELKASTS